MIPGFIPRLHAEIVRALATPSSPQQQSFKNRKPRLRPQPYDRYAPLRQLLPYFVILNNPDPPTEEKDARSVQKKPSAAGKAPAFTPACMAWVGGSLAGYVTLLGRIRHLFTITPSLKITKNRRHRDTQREMGGSGYPRGSRNRGRGHHYCTFFANLTSLQQGLT